MDIPDPPNPGATLTQAGLQVLLAIGPGERHGYAIMTEVGRISGGHVRMGPGTLYGTIKRLLEAGLIEESGERPDPEHDDERRKYYRLTAEGRATARSEVARLRMMLDQSGASSWAN